MSDFATNPGDDLLLAYLDEMLSVPESARIEQRLREEPEYRVRLAALLQQRDQGGHTVGEIWRRHRLSCPDRPALESFLRGVASPAGADYIQFHLDVVGCRLCQANLDDLQRRLSDEDTQRQSRQRRFFDSSAGFLTPRPDK